jgi:hypothetical protein
LISNKSSRVPLCVIRTDEELMIARSVLVLLHVAVWLLSAIGHENELFKMPEMKSFQPFNLLSLCCVPLKL